MSVLLYHKSLRSRNSAGSRARRRRRVPQVPDPQRSGPRKRGTERVGDQGIVEPLVSWNFLRYQLYF